ncbi:MAG: fibronectin type III domain-containing protein, partial [Candidatus Anstonellales archaeon]
IKMRTNVSQAVWQRIRLEKIGSSSDPNLPYGKNTDVGYIKIYKDANFNEQLDAADILISEIASQLVVEVSSNAKPPFLMVISSTYNSIGVFPENQPQLWVKVNDEIFEYTKITTTTIDGIEYPALYITKRAHLGSYVQYHSTGSIVRKCDMFYLNDDLNRQKEVTLIQPQLISPTPQTYFIAYDIGENAIAGNAVGVKLIGKEAITIAYPNETSPQIEIEQDIQGVSVKEDIYPYETSLIRINPITLTITAESVAPVQVPQKTKDVPFMMISMNTDRNYVMVKKIYITQTGTVQTPGAIGGYGQGDLSSISLWLDNGDGFFSAVLDTFITSVTHPTVDFSAGAARITLAGSGLYVSTSPVRIFVVADIGKTDLAGTSTKDHYVGVEITSFKSIETIPQTIESSIVNRFPLKSSLVLILDEYAPRVLPRWAVLAQKKIWANPFGDGYPAIDVDGDGKPDRIYHDGEVFIDIDEDGINDLEDLDGDGRKNDLDLVGDGKPSIDMTGDGFLDIDFNCDGKPDSVVPDINGDGIPEIDLSRDGVIDWGYTPERWTNRTTQLFAQWKHTPQVLDYRVGAGNVANVNNLTDSFAPGGWLSTRKAPRFTITNLSLQAAKVTRLVKSVSRLDTPPFDLFVESTDGFPAEKADIYVGGEIMYYETKSQNSFRITQRAKYDTPAQDHPAYTKVTNQGTYYRVHGIGQDNTVGPVISLMVYRVDITPPKAPSKPVSDYDRLAREITEGVFTIEWEPSSDEESGIMGYEIQERVDTNPVWKTIRFVPGSRTSFVVGNSDTPDNKPREKGHFYYYRVRAKNYAGSYSVWSEVSNGVCTGLPEQVISQVSNYPNPVDTRLGGEEGKTWIVYVLNQDAEVTLTIYDLLGYKV